GGGLLRGCLRRARGKRREEHREECPCHARTHRRSSVRRPRRAERYHEVVSIVMLGGIMRGLVPLLVWTLVLVPAAAATPKEKPAPLAWRQTAGPYGALVRSVGFTPSGELLVGTETGS